MQVKLPLEIGTRVDCRWRDGEYHPARVIEKRPVEGTDQHEYYMHYSKCRLLRHVIHAACCLRMQSCNGARYALRILPQSFYQVWHQEGPFCRFVVLVQHYLHKLMMCHAGHVWHCADRSLMMHAVNRRMDEWVKQENLNLNTVDVGDVDGSDPK